MTATRARTALALLVSLAVLALSMVPYGQVTVPRDWLQASGNPYRTASIPPQEATGAITRPSLLWGQGLPGYTGSGWGWNPVHSQPVVGNIERIGSLEVVVCDSAGNLIVFSGSNGQVQVWGWVGCTPFSPPVLVDFDGDGLLEVIVVLEDDGVALVEVYQGGTWQVNVTLTIRPGIGRGGGVLVHDIDNDGILEIILQGAGGLALVRPGDGTLEWVARHGVYSSGLSPVLVDDINGDGVNDIVAPGFYATLTAYSGADGSIIWRLNLWDDPQLGGMFIAGQPLAADFDGDGTRELVVSLGKEIFDWDPAAGNSGSTSTGLMVAKQGTIGYILVVDIFSGTLQEVIPAQQGWAWFSQPAMASYDLDGDGEWEVVFASADGCLYLADYNGGTPSIVRLVRLDDWWAWDVWVPYVGDPGATGAPPSAASVVLADMDGDGVVEALCLSTNSNDGYPRYTLELVDVVANTTEWTFWIDWTMVGVTSYSYSYYAWPGLAVADADGDGSLEAVASVYQGVVVVDG